MTERRQDQARIFDHDIDRYPTFNQGMQRILNEAAIDDAPIDRLEVRFLANGDCTYRYWTPRAEEPEGGFLSGADAG